jgi:NADH dehydrogenase FAD-containing subunit
MISVADNFLLFPKNRSVKYWLNVCSLGEHDAVGVAYGIRVTGRMESVLKKIIDNKALYRMRNASGVRKGKFNLFCFFLW